MSYYHLQIYIHNESVHEVNRPVKASDKPGKGLYGFYAPLALGCGYAVLRICSSLVCQEVYAC